MNHSNVANYEINAPETRLDSRCVREGKGFYIPEIVTDEAFHNNPKFFSNAFGHAKNLSKARLLLGEALHQIGSMTDTHGDDHVAQTGPACRAIEKLLRKAYNRLERHDRRHTNLFLVYFDLKGRIDAASKQRNPGQPGSSE